jgi:Glyoxalase-like domain
MPAFVKNLTFDCVDALRVARFWAAVLGSDVDEDSTSERAYVEASAWGGPNLWFRGARGPRPAPTTSTSTCAPSPPWTRRSPAFAVSARRWSNASTTSPSCTTPKATSSASSSVPATPTRRRVAERRSRLLEQRVEPREQRLAQDQHPGAAAASPWERGSPSVLAEQSMAKEELCPCRRLPEPGAVRGRGLQVSLGGGHHPVAPDVQHHPKWLPKTVHLVDDRPGVLETGRDDHLTSYEVIEAGGHSGSLLNGKGVWPAAERWSISSTRRFPGSAPTDRALP